MEMEINFCICGLFDRTRTRLTKNCQNHFLNIQADAKKAEEKAAKAAAKDKVRL